MFLGQLLDSSNEVGHISISQFDYGEILSFFLGTNWLLGIRYIRPAFVSQDMEDIGTPPSMNTILGTVHIGIRVSL